MPDKLNDLRIHVLEEINVLPWLREEYYQHRKIILQDRDKAQAMVYHADQ